MSYEEKAVRVLADECAGLPSASMSYVLARADAYDAIRADEKFAAWSGMAGGVDGVCLRGSWLHGLNHADSDCDLLVGCAPGCVCAIVVFIGRFSLWNFQVLDWAFRPSMRTFGVKIAAAEMGLCAYFLPHGGALSFPGAFLLRCRGVRGCAAPPHVRDCVWRVCLFLSACWRCTLPVNAVHWCSVRGSDNGKR